MGFSIRCRSSLPSYCEFCCISHELPSRWRGEDGQRVDIFVIHYSKSKNTAVWSSSGRARTREEDGEQRLVHTVKQTHNPRKSDDIVLLHDAGDCIEVMARTIWSIAPLRTYIQMIVGTNGCVPKEPQPYMKQREMTADPCYIVAPAVRTWNETNR